MKPVAFTWHPAASVDEAVAVLEADPGAVPLGGGQSLVPLLAGRRARPTVLVDLEPAGLDDLALDETGDVLVVGAMVRQRRLEHDPLVQRAVPLLAAAVRHVGHPSTRVRGTLGGSLAHADPVAELPAVAVALGSSVTVAGPLGRRSLPAGDLAAGPFATTLGRGEVLTGIRLPVAGPRHGASWQEWSQRHHDFAEVGAGVAVELDWDGAITGVMAAACGVGGIPLPLGEVIAGAGVLGAATTPAALLRAVAAAVTAAATAAGAGPPGERAELCGLLAARALHCAVRDVPAP